jgi:hypothetical protein
LCNSENSNTLNIIYELNNLIGFKVGKQFVLGVGWGEVGRRGILEMSNRLRGVNQ